MWLAGGVKAPQDAKEQKSSISESNEFANKGGLDTDSIGKQATPTNQSSKGAPDVDVDQGAYSQGAPKGIATTAPENEGNGKDTTDLSAAVGAAASQSDPASPGEAQGVQNEEPTQFSPNLPRAWKPSLQKSNPSQECIRRIHNDIRTLMRDPIEGLLVCPDEVLVTVIHALVTGPFDTPYEGGFFYFIIECPDDYPRNPPRVRLMTTGGGSVRFNPNLYANGKVCLSILGTWVGPAWTPVQSIASVLLSIQSLMCEKPYHNEPGYEHDDTNAARAYNDCLTHETLRVAVCSMVADTSLWRSMPEMLQKTIRAVFLSFMPRYEFICTQNMHRDGELLNDPFHRSERRYEYGKIWRSVQDIADMIRASGEEG